MKKILAVTSFLVAMVLGSAGWVTYVPATSSASGDLTTHEADVANPHTVTIQQAVNDGSGPVTNAAYMVQTNATDVTFAGWRFFYEAGAAYLQARSENNAYIQDQSDTSVLWFSTSTRYLDNTNGNEVASFADVFRVGPDGGTNLAVYTTLTNHTDRIEVLEAAGGTVDMAGMTNWGGSVVDASVSFAGNDLTDIDAFVATNITTGIIEFNSSTSSVHNGSFGVESSIYPVTGQTHSFWFGTLALDAAVGEDNVGFGYYAGYDSSGDDNAAYGAHSLMIADGSGNTAIGKSTLNRCVGSYNVGLGFYAGNYWHGSSNIFIGVRAGYDVPAGTRTNSHMIVIGAEAQGKSDWSAVWGTASHTNYFDGEVVISNSVAISGTLQVDDLMCELYLTDGTLQAFTGGGSPETVTNWTERICDASFTHNAAGGTITNLVAGRYTIYLEQSFETSAAEVMDMKLYTNTVVVASSGWERSTTVTAAKGVCAYSVTLTLPANTRMEWKLDTSSGGIAAFQNHTGTFRVERR